MKLSTKIIIAFSIIAFAFAGVFIGLKSMPKLSSDDDFPEIVIEKRPVIEKEKTPTKVAPIKEEVIEVIEEDLTNILLIGVDEGGYDSARSDVMIIATIDSENKLLKLTSVMRDTLAYIPTSQTYQKLNHSYMEGGPLETMKAINTNLDLDIKDYIVFDFNTVKKAVDLVGGYPVNVTSGEAKDMGISKGQQTLNGKEAIQYMRVRYNSGGDPGRNQRQRDLIFYIMEYAKGMDKLELAKFASKIVPIIRTSYSLKDIDELIDLYLSIKDGITTEQHSFPSDYYGGILKDGLWYAVPKTMKTNVIELQNTVFNSPNYSPNDTVETISKKIEYRSGISK